MSGGKIYLQEPSVHFSKLKKQTLKDDHVQYIEKSKLHKAFFDIDNLHGHMFKYILETMDKVLDEIYESAVYHHRVVFKSSIKPKYHVYYPHIIVNAGLNLQITKRINEQLKAEVIDTSGFTGSKLRIEGFFKYNKRTRGYDYGTNYIYMKKHSRWNNEPPAEWSIEFYEATMLFVDDKGMYMCYFLFASFERETKCIQQGVLSEGKHKRKTEQSKLKTNIPKHVADIIYKYPCKQATTLASGCIIWDFKKNIEGRTCISGRVHKSNNCYIIYNPTSGMVTKKCRDESCTHLYKILYQKPVEPEHKEQSDKDLFINTSETIINEKPVDLEHKEESIYEKPVEHEHEDVSNSIHQSVNDSEEIVFSHNSNENGSPLLGQYAENSVDESEEDIDLMGNNESENNNYIESEDDDIMRNTNKLEMDTDAELVKNQNNYSMHQPIPENKDVSQSKPADDNNNNHYGNPILQQSIGAETDLAVNVMQITIPDIIYKVLKRFQHRKPHYPDSNTVEWDIKKMDARRCISGPDHRVKSSYLQYNSKTQTLYRKCRHPGCSHKQELIYRIPNYSEADSDVESDGDSKMENFYPTDLSDVKYGEKFKLIYGQSFISIDDNKNGNSKSIYFHNGIKWAKDKGATRLRYHIETLTRLTVMAFEDENNEESYDDENNNRKKKSTTHMGSQSKIKSIEKRVEDYIYKSPMWNEDEELFVFENGVFNLKTGVFGGTDPMDYVSDIYGVANYNFIIDASVESNIILLEDIATKVLHEDKEEVLSYLSLALHGRRYKYTGFLIGHKGNEGKSLLKDLTLYCLNHKKNGYSHSASESTFAIRGKGSGFTSDTFTKNSMSNKRFVTVDELSAGCVLSTGELKRYSGTDEFNARGFNSAETECTSRMTLLFCSNYMPKFDELDTAMRARLLIWNCKSQFCKDENREKYSEEKRIYKAEPEYETIKWKMSMRVAWFLVLHKRLKKIIEGSGPNFYAIAKEQTIFEEAQKRPSEFDIWMETIVENKIDHISKYANISQLLPHFQKSDLCKDSPKAQTLLRGFIKESEKFSKTLVNRQTLERHTYRSFLRGWIMKPEQESICEDIDKEVELSDAGSEEEEWWLKKKYSLTQNPAPLQNRRKRKLYTSRKDDIKPLKKFKPIKPALPTYQTDVIDASKNAKDL